MSATHSDRVLTEIDARQYFQDAIQSAMANQQVQAREETLCYIVNLLAGYMRADQLFEAGAEGLLLKPLALMYAEALGAPTECDRDSSLKRLGDVALFISGLFSNSLCRSLVDLDYYIQMGGNAYGFLADSARIARKTRALKITFTELSHQFAAFTDVLAEVSEAGRLNNSVDIMRLYEFWQATGSRRIALKLRSLGIEPVSTHGNTH
jgi:hypothetical protein